MSRRSLMPALLVSTNDGRVSADRVVVATNAWAEPVRQMRRYVVPVYDHVLMTEPLSDHQMAEIGWSDRQALTDAANQFHYYRLTADNRILWGGYDANYYFGNGMGPAYEQRPSSHQLLAGHFFDTFPQLEGLGFSHRWAGPIGTTSKFTAAFGHGLRPNAPNSKWSARSRCHSRRNHFVTSSSRRLEERSPKTTEPAGPECCSACWSDSESGSTARCVSCLGANRRA